MKANKAKMVVAGLLKTGSSKVWVDPAQLEKVGEAMTKEDVRNLISQNVIKEKKISRKNKKRALARKKGRKRGFGKRKGTQNARDNAKDKWIRNVRAQRKKLTQLKNSSAKFKIPYRAAYKMVKGGYFRGKKHLESTVVGVKK